MASTITELKQKTSYTHDNFGNEYKVPLDQMSEEQLENLLQKMNEANSELLRLSKMFGWGI